MKKLQELAFPYTPMHGLKTGIHSENYTVKHCSTNIRVYVDKPGWLVVVTRQCTLMVYVVQHSLKHHYIIHGILNIYHVPNIKRNTLHV